MNRGDTRGRYRPYESVLLNELHEIIPEALYDADLFNSPLLRFFQQRVGHIYPAFHRERGLYLREQADSRRHAFRSTRLSRVPNPIIPASPTLPPTVVQSLESSSLQDSFLRTLLLSIVAENAARPEATPPSQPSTDAAEDEEQPPRNVHRLVRTERAGITVTIPGGTTTWWDPVSIRPSVSVYNRNTALVDASGVPVGTVCTICQSAPGEDLSGATVDTMWRKLLGCQHFFHKRCADRWFEQHIQCPNCRADIRTPQLVPSAQAETVNM